MIALCQRCGFIRLVTSDQFEVVIEGVKVPATTMLTFTLCEQCMDIAKRMAVPIYPSKLFVGEDEAEERQGLAKQAKKMLADLDIDALRAYQIAQLIATIRDITRQ